MDYSTDKQFKFWKIQYFFKYKEITRCRKCGFLHHDPFLNCDNCNTPFWAYCEFGKLPNGRSHGTLYEVFDNKETVLAKWSPLNGWRFKENK